MNVREEIPGKKTRSSGRMAALFALLVTGMLVILAATIVLAGPQLLARSLPLSPWQEGAEIQSLAANQAEARERLNSYGWVDRDRGVAHIPVAEAVKQVAGSGLPVGAPTVTSLTDNGETDAEIAIPDEVSFANHVLPILVDRCSECHGSDNPEEGLEVTSYRTLMLGSIYGSVIEAGDAEGSYLFEQVNSGKMPKNNAPLTPNQIETIRTWIDAGALDN